MKQSKRNVKDPISRLYNSPLRIINWVLSKSGAIPLAIEHFLAMLPATILVPLLVNKECGDIIDVSLVLLTSGIGTLFFLLFSAIHFDRKKKRFYFGAPIPAYLGSSFAYIAITIYLINNQTVQGVEPGMAFVYVGWAYFFSSILLLILSTLFYCFKNIDRYFSKYLPAAVIGPAISLIGLELSDNAISDAGFKAAEGGIDYSAILVSMTTLITIIAFSLIKRKFWKNAAIIIGMVAGFAVHVILNGFPDLQTTAVFQGSHPNWRFILLTPPPNWQWLFVSIIPSTLVVFTESIGRITVINRMKAEEGEAKVFNRKSMKTIGQAVFSHGIASFTSSLIGSVPNTIYAENIAVMGIHKNRKNRKDPCKWINKITNPYSVFPYILASLLAIGFSFSDVLQKLIINIPKPVIGGMELFLFGVISAPGIQLLVDQRVDYKKTSNQIITAAVLLTGISELSIQISWFELKGMSLGLVVGFVLNVFVIILKSFGILCDALTTDEVLIGCLSSIPKSAKEVKLSIPNYQNKEGYPSPDELISFLEGYGNTAAAEYWQDSVSRASEVQIFNADRETMVRIVKRENSLIFHIPKAKLRNELVDVYLNDYKDATDIDYDSDSTELLVIDLSRNIPLSKVELLVAQMTW